MRDYSNNNCGWIFVELFWFFGAGNGQGTQLYVGDDPDLDAGFFYVDYCMQCEMLYCYSLGVSTV